MQQRRNGIDRYHLSNWARGGAVGWGIALRDGRSRIRLLAKLWHKAQMLPAPSKYVRQILYTFALYKWQGPSLEYPSPRCKGGRRNWLGPHRWGDKLPGTPAIPAVDTRPTWLRNNRGMATVLEPKRAEGEPAPRVEDPKKPRILAYTVYALEISYIEPHTTLWSPSSVQGQECTWRCARYS
jgi:hypothetical protein